MKNSTPIIMGIVLIVGLAAIGYLDQFNYKSNNSSNNSSYNPPFKYSIPGNQQLNYDGNTQQLLTTQTSSGNVSSSNSSQNSSNNIQNGNVTS
jgi:hypothetical protein